MWGIAQTQIHRRPPRPEELGDTPWAPQTPRQSLISWDPCCPREAGSQASQPLPLPPGHSDCFLWGGLSLGARGARADSCRRGRLLPAHRPYSGRAGGGEIASGIPCLRSAGISQSEPCPLNTMCWPVAHLPALPQILGRKVCLWFSLRPRVGWFQDPTFVLSPPILAGGGWVCCDLAPCTASYHVSTAAAPAHEPAAGPCPPQDPPRGSRHLVLRPVMMSSPQFCSSPPVVCSV